MKCFEPRPKTGSRLSWTLSGMLQLAPTTLGVHTTGVSVFAAVFATHYYDLLLLSSNALLFVVCSYYKIIVNTCCLVFVLCYYQDIIFYLGKFDLLY